jgi:hypothetical protein
MKNSCYSSLRLQVKLTAVRIIPRLLGNYRNFKFELKIKFMKRKNLLKHTYVMYY